MFEAASGVAILVGGWAWFRVNQWLVGRKGLDHRPWFAPSLWGPLGTLLILLAEPRGWRRHPSPPASTPRL